MSTNPDDRLGELSPPERDFLQRRMPVQTLAESYREACEAPVDTPTASPSRLAKAKIDRLRTEMDAGCVWLFAAGLESLAVDVARLSDEIEKALK